MTNHIHLLVQVGDAPLDRIMLRIASRYARTVQARLDTTGHLFERRYHAQLVDADAYLLTLIRYIHHNPCRAGIAGDPADYRWSSHHAYLGRRQESWVTTDFALQMFHTDRARAIAGYRQFMGVVAKDPDAAEQIETNSVDPRVLGDDRFLARCAGESWRPRSGRTLAELIEEGCRRFAVAPADLASASRVRRVTSVRAWIAREAIEQRVASLSEVARTFGRDESTLRESLRRLIKAETK